MLNAGVSGGLLVFRAFVTSGVLGYFDVFTFVISSQILGISGLFSCLFVFSIIMLFIIINLCNSFLTESRAMFF
jgi:hypothetical protein